jgi:hypothetical protein
MKLLATLSLIICFFQANAQSVILKVGTNYNSTIQKLVPENPGISLIGFDPKYGYQVGISYKQPLIKSLFLSAEIGYLNKGNQRISSTTKKNLGDVNFNYLFFAPSIGYDLPYGFSAKLGVSINKLLNHEGAVFNGIQAMDYAYLAALNYNYKRIGLEISYNKSIQPVQKITLLGQGFDHYHKWLTASLTFQLFKKQAKTP